MKRVSFKQYQILKAIYENVIVVSASDNEALIFKKVKRKVEDKVIHTNSNKKG